MDITAASTERTIHIRICHHLWIRAFNMYIFKIPGFYECPISWVHFIPGYLADIFTNRFFPYSETLGAQGLTTSPGHYFHFFVIARAPYTAFI